MGVVAAYLCVDYSWKLVTNFKGIRLDREARDDCPLAARELGRQRKRLLDMRDTIMHLAEMTVDGSRWNIAGARDPDLVVTISTVNPERGKAEAMTTSEILGLLDVLDPWLQRQFHRLVLAT